VSETADHGGGTGPSHRAVEIGVALATAAVGLVAIVGSLQVGIGWAAEGPRAGFFPFYVGVIVVGSAAINLLSVAWNTRPGLIFSEWRNLRQVLAVVVPTAIYVAIIPFSGIYVASAFLIAAFMLVVGRYPWWYVLPVSVGVPLATFLMFERWFLVPLPKGPLESFFGY
jgi:hypothetical protein